MRVFQQDLSKTLLMYTVPAVQGFFRSISLSRGNNLQDTLRYQSGQGPGWAVCTAGHGITRNALLPHPDEHVQEEGGPASTCPRRGGGVA